MIGPTEPKYFKEEMICETVMIPMGKPRVGQLLDIMVWPEVIDIKLLETPKGKSYEGNCLTGNKLLVQLLLKEKIAYISEDTGQNTYIMPREVLKSVYVTLPEYIDEKRVSDLVRGEKMKVTAYIEDVGARVIDRRNIYKFIMILVDVSI
ncbi:MAG: hypothetical protein ACRC1P_09390 [Cellulosilyticaceae bacterium]